MGMLLLWCAASIIVPIIKAEGIIAVFFPYLVRQPQVRPFPAVQTCLSKQQDVQIRPLGSSGRTRSSHGCALYFNVWSCTCCHDALSSIVWNSIV